MARIDRSRLASFYERLLIDRSGQPRRAALRLLIADSEPRRFVRALFFKKNGIMRPHLSAPVRSFFEAQALARWIEAFDTPPKDWLRERHDGWDRPPPILVVMPLGDDAPEALERAQSVIDSQGVSTSVLLTGAGASGRAVARLLSEADIPVFGPDDPARRSFARMVHLGRGSVLRPHGLRLLTDALAKAGTIVAAYSDTVICEGGALRQSWFKPAFSPILVRSLSLFDAVFAVDLEAAGGLDLVDADWRSFERSLVSRQVAHVPHVCYRLGVGVMPDAASPAGSPTFRPMLGEAHPQIAIIIPTRNRWDLLGPCLASIEGSDWPADRLEIIVVDNGSDEAETVARLSTLAAAGTIVLLRDDGDFNYPRLNNRAAAAATDAELLVFLNNDTEIRDAEWLRKLAHYAVQPSVGAVGAKLLYANDTVQHAGVIVGIHGGAGHGFVGISLEDGGYNGLALADREVSAVTGACLAVRRKAFLDAGGFDETLRVAFNDIALCSALRGRGLENVLVADALVTHHESRSRGLDATASQRLRNAREVLAARRRHDALWRVDPYYSPNLSLEAPYQIASVPRRRPAWNAGTGKPPHVLILHTSSHRDPIVAVAAGIHARALRKAGFRVSVGGPDAAKSDDIERVRLDTARAASGWALRHGVVVIWAHSPPFFACARHVGGLMRVLACDYGAEPPRLFADWQVRAFDDLRTRLDMTLCDRIFTCRAPGAAASAIEADGVIPLGNDHLLRWSEAMDARRLAVRARHDWGGCSVMLTLCESLSRDAPSEGIETYLELMRQRRLDAAQLDGQARFVLAGHGGRRDVARLRAAGLEIFANLSGDSFVDLFAASDAYVSVSRREGYDPGIAQALALGLPVVAPDSRPHGDIELRTYTNMAEASGALGMALSENGERQARLWSWSEAERIVVAETRRSCEST